MKKRQIVLILLIIFLPLIIFIVVYNRRAFTRGLHEKVNVNLNQNVNQNFNVNNNLNVNENENLNENENINAGTGMITSQEVTLTGRVFIKGYGTASESYGILTKDDQEVGLGAYDSMKEQFRPYVNDQVKVVFSKICHSTTKDCCLSLYYYCGTVKSFEPVLTNTNQ